MPYVRCPHCGVSCFSVARHSRREACPVCDGELHTGLSVVQPAQVSANRFCDACGGAIEPDDDVVQVLSRPVHASCAVYRARRSA
jgi:ribosomal protein S27AE